MKKITIWLLMLISGTAMADNPLVSNPYGGVHLIRGTVISAGRVDPSVNVGTGYFVDVNYTSVALNIGVASKKLGEAPFKLISQDRDEDALAAKKRVNNVYVGLGFGRIIQYQFGYGNQGRLTRLRSDFNVRSITDFMNQKSTPRSRLTLADRLTFSVSVERYAGDEDIFNNFTWGVGLLF